AAPGYPAPAATPRYVVQGSVRRGFRAPDKAPRGWQPTGGAPRKAGRAPADEEKHAWGIHPLTDWRQKTAAVYPEPEPLGVPRTTILPQPSPTGHGRPPASLIKSPPFRVGAGRARLFQPLSRQRHAFMSKQPSISYKDAGVDIDAGEALVERIKGVAKRTARPEVMGGLGGFGA